ncbi:MAG TPA: galactose-1-phosphate uridylyltransferase, partial [Candidatus Omnitrophica bacterium]|nr:galactose-1-phosphate uridylyltransferase [Candidatus Omnitrophota bacterium]
MSEVRQNLATREWVVIAPARSKKPKSLNVNIDPELTVN